MDIAAWSTYQFEFYILVFFRVMGLFVIAPFFGSEIIPINVKILLSLLIAVVIFPAIPKVGIALPGSLGGLIFAALGETAIGVIIGIVATMFMSSIQLGGHWVGQQIGLTLANVIDPTSNVQLSIIEQFKFILAMLVFIGLNGHHYLLEALIYTFQKIPVTGFSLSTETSRFISIDVGREMYLFALKVAAPFIIILLMVTVGMGFIAKTVPEINIFIIGFSLRILAGFTALYVAVPALAYLFEKIFSSIYQNVDKLIDMMSS